MATKVAEAKKEPKKEPEKDEFVKKLAKLFDEKPILVDVEGIAGYHYVSDIVEKEDAVYLTAKMVG